LLEATRTSSRTLRGLTGEDRWALYLTALSTGFRAGELASLNPRRFLLDQSPPVIRLGEDASKNDKGAVQPLPPAVVEALRPGLARNPADLPVWPGRWVEKPVALFRRDLAAAGIPYVVEGPDGPLYADFHATRHTFIALLDRSGATLKEAMQL